ncbi:DUF6483 family protein [Paenibacillus sp. CC-CFT747]|nr:DUF6483 family protein [Paenibacillus sp. CC-CFT747]
MYESLGEQDQAYLRHLKGLQLGLAASENNVETSALDYHADIQALIDRLSAYELPPQMKARLFVYYEKAGQYDQAENLLYELLPLNPEQMREIGIRFYENLLLKSPEEREAGGLPGEEVEEGLTDWLQKTAGVESV